MRASPKEAHGPCFTFLHPYRVGQDCDVVEDSWHGEALSGPLCPMAHGCKNGAFEDKEYAIAEEQLAPGPHSEAAGLPGQSDTVHGRTRGIMTSSSHEEVRHQQRST